MSEFFVGHGLAYPMRVGPTGGIALVTNDEEIAESMRLILGTSPGERPMCDLGKRPASPGLE